MTAARITKRSVVLERCRFRIPVGAAYTPCNGDHPREQHNAADMATFSRGLEFAAVLVHKEARFQTEQAMRGTDGAQYAADRMAEVEKALRGVMATFGPARGSSEHITVSITIEPGDRQTEEDQP